MLVKNITLDDNTKLAVGIGKIELRVKTTVSDEFNRHYFNFKTKCYDRRNLHGY